MPTVQPAIRSPHQTVDDIVMNLVLIPSVEHHFGLTIGNVVTVAIRNEKQFWRGQHPRTAKAQGHTRRLLSFVPKNGSLVEMAVVVRVFQDDNAIAQIIIEARFIVSVGLVLHHP